VLQPLVSMHMHYIDYDCMVEMPSADIDTVAFALRAGLCEAVVCQASSPSELSPLLGEHAPSSLLEQGWCLGRVLQETTPARGMKGGSRASPTHGACWVEASDVEASRSILSGTLGSVRGRWASSAIAVAVG
jgi:hypothetical protein